MTNELDYREQLISKIIQLSQYLWDGRINNGDLSKWLGNFQYNESASECEQLHALYVLSNFMYFGREEVRALLLAAYRDKIRIPLIGKIRKENDRTASETLIERKFSEELNATRFLGVGNPSESGSHLLYYFRQECRLTPNHFIHAHQVVSENQQVNGEWRKTLVDSSVKRYVFIDDLCGSGEQAIEYAQIVNDIKSIDPDIDIHYVCLFGSSNGLLQVREGTSYDRVDAVFTLDESFRCFSESSRFFNVDSSVISKDFAKRTFETHGHRLIANHPLGFNDGQQLLGFEHNIPDNTLPAIWYDEDRSIWFPILKRYVK